MTRPIPAVVETAALLQIAADQYNRYPGELATLYVQFRAPQAAGARLQLAMPQVAIAETYHLPPGVPSTLPVVAGAGADVVVLIPLDTYFTPGAVYDIAVGVRLRTFHADQHLLIEARLLDASANTLAEAGLRLTVFGKGKYLQYLPEIYQNDDFMGRFLMLFETFWKPISLQIDQAEYYFDPDLTPPGFVPWLASWVGLPVDESLPMARVRALLKNAMTIFQCRGTLQALRLVLEIYTGGRVTVRERRASNFVLGAQAALGMGIALGTANQPSRVEIHLDLDAAELTRTGYTPQTYERKMTELARGMVPAHVSYALTCAFHAPES